MPEMISKEASRILITVVLVVNPKSKEFMNVFLISLRFAGGSVVLINNLFYTKSEDSLESLNNISLPFMKGDLHEMRILIPNCADSVSELLIKD